MPARPFERCQNHSHTRNVSAAHDDAAHWMPLQAKTTSIETDFTRDEVFFVFVFFFQRKKITVSRPVFLLTGGGARTHTLVNTRT